MLQCVLAPFLFRIIAIVLFILFHFNAFDACFFFFYYPIIHNDEYDLFCAKGTLLEKDSEAREFGEYIFYIQKCRL